MTIVAGSAAPERLVSVRTGRQLVVLSLGGFAAAAGLYLARDTIVPFIVALLVAYLIMPAVDYLAARRVPRWLAVLLVFAGIVLAVLLVLQFLLPPLVEQLEALVAALPSVGAEVRDWYLRLELDPAARATLDRIMAGVVEAIRGIDVGTALQPVIETLAGVLGTVLAYAFTPFFVFYVALDKERIVRGFDRSLPDGWRADIWAVLGIGDRVFGQWVRSTIVLAVILGVASLVGMGVFSVVIDPVFGRFAVVLATIAFFSEFVPIIGPFFPLIAGVLVGLTVGPGAALAAGLYYFALTQIEANVFVPRIQGRALSLSPAAVIAVLIMGTAAAGLLGALLAIPVVSTVVLVLRYLFRRASGLIGPPAPPPAPERGPLVDDLVPGVATAPQSGAALVRGTTQAPAPTL